MSFLSKIFGDANQKAINASQVLVDRINQFEPEFEKLSSDELKNKTTEFKKRISDGESLDDILPEAFAAVREASKRTLNQRHYDVQLMGGIALHNGNIAEMRTGEGKTLVATLPTYLNALSGKGVHVVTVNDYLARRDAAWMGQVYNALGLMVGCINHDQSYLYDATHQKKGDSLDAQEDKTGSFHIVYEFLRPVTKKESYNADITYGTNNEYGFDYLRDNMAFAKEDMVQREFNFAIVDEVDSILIDEARTPLIISAPDTESTKLYETFSKVVPRLDADTDYTVDEKRRAVSITDSGIEKVERALNIKNIYDEGGIKYVHQLEQALSAHVLYKKDRHYVVKDGQVIIVDEFTGRLMPGRRWSDGLHQAVEAKEGVTIQRESRTMATITFQNYFKLYKKLSGMTGTAKTSAEEFHSVYGLDVITIPTNKAAVRKDLPDRIYKTESGKFKAVVATVKELNKTGQPVLLGTASIDKNELLSAMLEREGIKHNVLNAKNHEREAEIIAQAGRLGAVTVATNMAGRGVDIILGGNPPDKEEAAKVRELGGLYVIGTERHDARRTDDQLRGRSGRQGDPGVSQFYISTQDELIRIFGGDRLFNMMNTLGVGEDEMVENSFVSRAILQAQTKVEGHHFDSRKYVLEYDNVMNKHRTAIYNKRQEIMFSDNNKETVLEYIERLVSAMTHSFASQESFASEESDSAQDLVNAFINFISDGQTAAPDGINKDEILEKIREHMSQNDTASIIDYLYNIAEDQYDKKEKEMTIVGMRQLEKAVLLRTIDQFWTDHIETMQHLQQSVQLRAYGQRDPLAEYKIEGQKLFDRLFDAIAEQAANLVFKVRLVQNPQPVQLTEERPDIAAVPGDKPLQINEPTHRAPVKTGDPKFENVGRNDLCPCGSGKKFKKCHGA